MWIAVPTNVVCGLLMPLAYVGFIVLQRSRAYLGEDRPGGLGGVAWVAGMIVATLVLLGGLSTAIVKDGPGYLQRAREAFGDSPEVTP